MWLILYTMDPGVAQGILRGDWKNNIMDYLVSWWYPMEHLTNSGVGEKCLDKLYLFVYCS